MKIINLGKYKAKANTADVVLPSNVRGRATMRISIKGNEYMLEVPISITEPESRVFYTDLSSFAKDFKIIPSNGIAENYNYISNCFCLKLNECYLKSRVSKNFSFENNSTFIISFKFFLSKEQEMGIISFYNDSLSNYIDFKYENENLFFSLKSNSSDKVDQLLRVEIKKWYDVKLQYDGKLSLYLNETLLYSKELKSDFPIQRCNVGKSVFSTNYFSGYFDELLIFKNWKNNEQ